MYKNIIFFGISVALFSGCATTDRGSVSQWNVAQDLAYRTTFCVRGNLPMEIQFVLDNNPPKLYGPTLSDDALDNLVSKIEVRVRSLLKKAGESAWREARSIPLESPAFSERLENEISIYLITNAAKELQLEFCGDKTVIGHDIDTTLLAYLGRSIDLGPNKRPEWLEKMPKGKERGMSMILCLVALRLAGSDVSTDALLESFDR